MPEPAEPAVDWTAIERSDEFQELVHGRQRFAAVAGAIGVGFGLLFVVLSHVADGLMEKQAIGGMSVGFLYGVCVVLVTWGVTLAYMRRSQQVWGPQEQRIRELAGFSA